MMVFLLKRLHTVQMRKYKPSIASAKLISLSLIWPQPEFAISNSIRSDLNPFSMSKMASKVPL